MPSLVHVQHHENGIKLKISDKNIVFNYSAVFPKPGGDWSHQWAIPLENHVLLVLSNGNDLATWLITNSGVLEESDPSLIANHMGLILPSDRTHISQISVDDGSFLSASAVCAFVAGNLAVCEAISLSLLQMKGICKDLFHRILLESGFKRGLFQQYARHIETTGSSSARKVRSGEVNAWLGRAAADRGDFNVAVSMFLNAFADGAKLPYWAAQYTNYVFYKIDWRKYGPIPDFLSEKVDAIRTSVGMFFSDRRLKPYEDPFPLQATSYVWSRTELEHFFLHEGGNLPDLIKEKLLSFGVSDKFIETIEQGANSVDRQIWEYCSLIDPRLQNATSVRVAEVAATALLAGKPTINPFTGQIEPIRDSLDIQVFLCQHMGKKVVVFSDPDISLAPSDRAWYFPQINLIISIGHYGSTFNEVAVLARRILQRPDDVSSYLTDEKREVCVFETSMGHIGHYIWNVISGWNSLFNIIPEKTQISFGTFRSGQFFGGVSELYSNEVDGKCELFDDQEQAWNTILDQRLLAVNLRDRHPSNELSKRVINWCRINSSDEYKIKLNEFIGSSSIIMMITLRFDNRYWVDQEEGWVSLLRALSEKHPRLGVIFDGLNVLPDGGGTFAPMSVVQEQECANRIASSCPNIRFFHTIGATISDSILACDSIDFFIAPVGAGLAKTRWICNKPGLAFSNEEFMTENHFEGFLYSHFRSDLVPMYYVEKTKIRNADSGNHGMIGRANFYMDWQELLNPVERLIAASVPRAVSLDTELR
ncbi:hypothetical protein C8J38_10839 [Rhizobium sp. PP-WC-2G-219]|nr:hypothetical protein C8J38_10839 [Rhizobium sp. PP-WC-2G-219]